MTPEPIWRTRLIRAVALLTAGYSAYYLWWRWTASLNPDALWFSIPLVLAETWGWLMFCAFVFSTWKLRHREPVPAPDGLSVAVFVTTCNEPMPVLRKTLMGANDITYPHRTYVLDDGAREDVRELASLLGVGYIRRPTHEHAKAGNLNYALSQTKEDFILQLDADHVPLPHILDRMLGYFADERVAFVQSPQDFYNFDSFTHWVDYTEGRVWEEQRIFFNVLQPGKDHWEAAFFCGSCGVIRRKALDDVGGFATETITEDVETSILLHARGWRSAYVEESLAYGLSPGTARAYMVQRLRWGQGSMQLLRKLNPLTQKGLSVAQRLAYFVSLVHYFDGYQRLMLIAAPFLFLATGVLPIRALDLEFLLRFFPYLVLVLVSFELLARGNGYTLLSERFAMAKWPVYMKAVQGLFTKRRLKFAVTPKGDESTPLIAYLPQLSLIVLTPIALAWAVFGPVHLKVRSAAFFMNAAWLFWYAYFSWSVVRRGRQLNQHEDYRFRDEIPVRFRIADRVGPDALHSIGITREIGSRSLRIATASRLDPQAVIEIELPLSTGCQSLRGVVHSERTELRAGVEIHDHVIDLPDIPESCQIAIERHCLHHAIPALSDRLKSRPDLFEDVRLWFRERRRERRSLVRFPVQVGVIEGGRKVLAWRSGVLEDLSWGGARLTTEHPVVEGSWLRYHVPGVSLEGEGMVTRVRMIETPIGRRWSVALERPQDLAEAG